MSQWEHLIVDLNNVSAKSSDIELLDALGQGRWELVTITPNKMAYLKQRTEEPAPPLKRATRRSAASAA